MEDVAPTASALLEPYDETRQMPSREVDCWCVGLQARREIEVEVEKKFNIGQLRTDFAELPKKERTRARWHEILKPRIALQEKLMESHPLNDMPSESCSNCDGTGRYMSTSNPDGKWDYWVIGGRWDGWIFGPERGKASSDDKHGFNFEDRHHTPENNTRLVHDIPTDDIYYCPFAVITPDGQWHQSGSMGWWGIVTDEIDPDEWHEDVKKLLAQYPNHFAVAVDCHV